MKRLFPYALVALVAFLIGAFSGIAKSRLVKDAKNMIVEHLSRRKGTLAYDDTSDRREVPCSRFAASPERTAILFLIGQSNAANFGETRMTPRAGAYNFNWLDGRCYVAKDPLLGSHNNKGSVWTRLSDMLLAAGVYDQILLVPIAVGGSRIQQWVPGARLHHRITDTIEGLRAADIRVTHVFWHQGEGNANGDTSREEYIENFGRILKSLRDHGIDAPVYPAVVSICKNQGSEELRSAQRALPKRFANVFPGPNSDRLNNFADRYDLCHFSHRALRAHAKLWFDAVWGNAAGRSLHRRPRATP